MKTVKKIVKVSANGSITEKIQDGATVKVIKQVPRTALPKEKNFVYKLDRLKVKPAEAKKLRGKIRRQLQAICNVIIVANVKKQDLTVLKPFFAFYKEHYILNDFSLQSITNSSDELKHDDINKVLQLAKIALAKK